MIRLQPLARAALLLNPPGPGAAPKDRLWIVDTGSIAFGPTAPGGPKLVGVDLGTDKVGLPGRHLPDRRGVADDQPR